MKLIITVLFLAAYYIFIFALMSASEAADNKSKREKMNEIKGYKVFNPTGIAEVSSTKLGRF